LHERIKNLDAKTVLIVDSNSQTQENLKALLEKLQFKTLCSQSPDDVQKMFAKDDLVAQCILFNGHSLGLRAIRAFNDFSQYRSLRDVGAVLLLDEAQLGWVESTSTKPNRVVMTMPIKVKELSETLTKMFEN